MSGAFGWGGSDRRKADDLDRDRNRGGFSRAQNAYQHPATPPQPAPQPASNQGASRAWGSNFGQSAQQPPAPTPQASVHRVHVPLAAPIVVDPMNRKITCTAKNVLIVCLDGTGSLGKGRAEIWARVQVLFDEGKQLLGDDLQIVFATFGDVKCRGDEVQIADPGAGPILDDHLAALRINYRGGGDEEESPEILGFYLLEQVDVSQCEHVYCYFITDEKAALTVDPFQTRRLLGVEPQGQLTTQDLFRKLVLKMETFIVLRRTDTQGYDPDRIQTFWEKILPERILPLDDLRRVVDVMLACVAKTTGQMDAFQQSFMARNQGSRYAAENFQTINQSVAMVGGRKVAAPSAHRPSRLMGSFDDDDDQT